MGSRLSRLHETFGLDLRSLGILRILLGGMLIVDYIIRIISLRAHYTDYGVLPVAAQMREMISNPGRFSIHMQSGDASFQIWLFALSWLFAVSLLVGFHTRLSLLGSLVMMISIQNRNFQVETGGDYLLRLVCMWALFLPMGARFSLDARAGRGVPHASSPGLVGSQYFSVATIALLMQMFCVYFFSAQHKNHPIWRETDLAIHYALHIDSYDTTLGEILRQYLGVTKVLTRVTLWFEFVAPWAIFGAGALSLAPGMEKSIVYQGPLRTFVALAFVLFHLGLGMTLSLGTFAWFSALIWVGLMPSYAWEQLAKWRRGERVFDVEADEIARFGPPPDKKLNDDAARKKTEPKESAEKDAHNVSPIPRPEWALRFLSRLEALGTRIEGPVDRGRAPASWVLRLRAVSRWGADGAAAVMLFYTFLWNLRTLEPRTYGPWIDGRGESFLPNARPLVNFLRLDQHWGLFAPYPRTTDGYFVVLGTKATGAQIDFLRKDEKVTWEKPPSVSGSFETFRWRKYFRDIRRPGKRADLRMYAEYVCRTYNDSHPSSDALQSVEVYFMARKTKPTPGHYPTEKQRLWAQQCLSTEQRSLRRRD